MWPICIGPTVTVSCVDQKVKILLCIWTNPFYLSSAAIWYTAIWYTTFSFFSLLQTCCTLTGRDPILFQYSLRQQSWKPIGPMQVSSVSPGVSQKWHKALMRNSRWGRQVHRLVLASSRHHGSGWVVPAQIDYDCALTYAPMSSPMGQPCWKKTYFNKEHLRDEIGGILVIVFHPLPFSQWYISCRDIDLFLPFRWV